jgi:hypothetical protein
MPGGESAADQLVEGKEAHGILASNPHLEVNPIPHVGYVSNARAFCDLKKGLLHGNDKFSYPEENSVFSSRLRG